MPALVAGIHVVAAANRNGAVAILARQGLRGLSTWMAATSAAMTGFPIADFLPSTGPPWLAVRQ